MPRVTKEQRAASAAQAEAFREELPTVKVLFPDGTILPGITQGRQADFCTVSVILHGAYVTVGEWNWEAIATAHSNGRPVRL